jgi:hypothetical protein
VEGTGSFSAPPGLPALASSPQNLLLQLAYGDTSSLANLEWGATAPQHAFPQR